MPKENYYNVQNSVTGEFIMEGDVPAEYTPESEAMGVAAYYTTTTGQQHVVVGPHPKPHA